MKTSKVWNGIYNITLGIGIWSGSSLLAEDAATKKLVVDDDKVQCKNADFSSIQKAVNAASEGAEIMICAGTYNEQVSITKSLKLLGDKGTVLKPDSLKISSKDTITDDDILSAITVKNAKDVVIEGISVDGVDVSSPDCAILTGFLAEDASVTVKNITIRNIFNNNSGVAACSDGNGIHVQSSENRESDVLVADSFIENCQTNAIVGNSHGTVVRAKNNIIDNIASASTRGNNGIELALGATGTIADNKFGTN